MKGIVLHHEKNWTYVLDQDGIFHRVRGFGERSVAEEVELPLLSARRSRIIISAAAGIIFFLLGAFAAAFGASSYYLCVDVNPSVEVSFNAFNRFTSARALNPEGEIILEGLSLRGPPEQVLSGLLERIGEYEYITSSPDGKAEVFITVVGRDEKVCADIEQRLQPLLADAGRQNPVVLSSCDFKFRKQAESLGVSSGVLLWAERFREQNEEIPLADILEMPVGDIVEGVQSHDGSQQQLE